MCEMRLYVPPGHSASVGGKTPAEVRLCWHHDYQKAMVDALLVSSALHTSQMFQAMLKRRGRIQERAVEAICVLTAPDPLFLAPRYVPTLQSGQ